jgi:hypothetical protein
VRPRQWWETSEDIDAVKLQARNRTLCDVLSRLVNAADGFVTMCDPWACGTSSIAAIRTRIAEARKALADAELNQ